MAGGLLEILSPSAPPQRTPTPLTCSHFLFLTHSLKRDRRAGFTSPGLCFLGAACVSAPPDAAPCPSASSWSAHVTSEPRSGLPHPAPWLANSAPRPPIQKVVMAVPPQGGRGTREPGTRGARILTCLHTHAHTHAHRAEDGSHPTQVGRKHSHGCWCWGPARPRTHSQETTRAGGRPNSPQSRPVPRGGASEVRTPETRQASPESFSESPRMGVASKRSPHACACAGTSSQRAHRAASGTAAGPVAGPARVWTRGCCWRRAGACPLPPGAPVKGTSGASRTECGARRVARVGLSLPPCRPRSCRWLKAPRGRGARWGRPPGGRSPAVWRSWAGWHPGSPAAWRSRRCGTTSWTPASRPWSRRGTRGSGSVPAHPALTGSGSVAW